MCKRATRLLLAAGLVISAFNTAARAVTPVEAHISHGRFERVAVLQPKDPVQRVVLWFVDDSADAQRRAQQIQALRDDGAMVAVVDTAELYRVLHKDGGSCVFSAGDVENFSRYLQAYYKLPTYHLPVLVADGRGAGLVYAVAAQAPAHVLAGVVTDGMCPMNVPTYAICGDGVSAHGGVLTPSRLPVPWLATASVTRCGTEVAGLLAKVPQARMIESDKAGDTLPGLQAAVRSLGAQHGVTLAPPPADLAGLPVIEIPAAGTAASAASQDTFAIFVSGDGGWAGLDKQVGGRLAQTGMPVVGVDSLRYFWSKRTPQGFAADLDRIARFYANRWHRHRVVLIGFSQGADVLPAAINRLPPRTHAMVAMTALMSVGERADYEFHLSNWLGADNGGLPIAPEIALMSPTRTLCIYGQDDDDALCPHLPAGAAQVVRLPGDHHFQGDYATLARVIEQHLAHPAS